MHHNTLEKCLQKNHQLQNELLKTKNQVHLIVIYEIELMIKDRQQQLKELLNVKETYSPYQAPQLQKYVEKCSAYQALEIIHDSKSRRIYQESLRYQRIFNFEDDFDEIKTEQGQITPTHFVELQLLKQINLQLKKPEKRRFRQHKFEKLNQSFDSSLKSQPRLTLEVQQRDYILNCIVNRLPQDGRKISWHLLPKMCTQIMALNTSDQVEVGAMEVFRVWLKKQQRPIPFKTEDDEQLTALVKNYGENQWALLSKMVGTRSSVQLRERWFKYVNPQIKKKRWSLLEDLKLMILVDYHSPVEWYKLSPFFACRTEVQLRERWCNVILPSLERKVWTLEEDEKLSKLKEYHGKAWSLISLQMNGRTDNECRRRWEQIERNESKQEEKKELLQLNPDDCMSQEDI